VKEHFLLVSILAVGCASPMTAMRDDNRRLNQTVTDLRADRRAHERKLRDLQRQVDKLRAQTVTAAVDGVPTLPVEVATPDRPASTSDRVSRPSPRTAKRSSMKRRRRQARDARR
jgi:hypothetical protein